MEVKFFITFVSFVTFKDSFLGQSQLVYHILYFFAAKIDFLWKAIIDVQHGGLTLCKLLTYFENATAMTWL